MIEYAKVIYRKKYTTYLSCKAFVFYQ